MWGLNRKFIVHKVKDPSISQSETKGMENEYARIPGYHDKLKIILGCRHGKAK